MTPPSLMFIAGEVSGDARAAELIVSLDALRRERDLPAPACFGAGGRRMRDAGMELVLDMTQQAVIGHLAAVKKYFHFRPLFHQLLELAIHRQPDAIVLVDFSGFNLRFAKAVRRHVKAHRESGWQPKIIYFVSPQLWASRPGRARVMEECVDLLISIIPFEKDWYARHAPGLKVEFVGHPLVEKFRGRAAGEKPGDADGGPVVVLLPGSRKAEVTAHLPLMLETLRLLRAKTPVRARVHLPNEELAALSRPWLEGAGEVEVRTGEVAASLADAALAITKSGTITLECALLRVPAVVLYVMSSMLFYIGRRVVNVPFLAMPNLLAGEAVYPEFVQSAATPANLARAATALLTDGENRRAVLARLEKVCALLGEPGASRRAAGAVLKELGALP